MKVTDTKIPEVKLIEPFVFEDERGFFFESFNLKKFQKLIGRSVVFVQDNHSKSNHGVLRGLHYQKAPNLQAKLVRVIHGEVFDVAVDIRKSSATFGKWIGETLSAENKKQLWIPEGFAHGFLTISNTAELNYKTTNYYCPHSENVISWDDKKIGINWPNLKSIILSKKDQKAKDLICSETLF